MKLARSTPHVEAPSVRRAAIDAWLKAPPLSRRRNQFTIPGEAERQWDRRMAELRAEWGLAWLLAFIEVGAHIQHPCRRCDGCRANGSASEEMS